MMASSDDGSAAAAAVNNKSGDDSKKELSKWGRSSLEQAWGEGGPVAMQGEDDGNYNRSGNDAAYEAKSSSKKTVVTMEEPDDVQPVEGDDPNNDASNETQPLTRNHSRRGNGDDEDDDVEEEELLYDTFTFLMTATYPLESFFCSERERNKAHAQEFLEEEETELALQSDTSNKAAEQSLQNTDDDNNNSGGKRPDPDKLYLPFWVGSFVIASQLFIYCVVIFNVFRGDIPPNADVVLRLAEIFAVIVTLYTQADFIDGIFLLSERWKAFKEISGPIKFNLSALCRILAGNVGILATFLLVMYSTEVVDLLLNFTAMEFVATLDDSAFELARKGFLGVTLEIKCQQIQDFRYHRRHTHKSRVIRCMVYLFYICLVIAGFITIVYLQTTRSVGIENEVYVQFDDTDLPELYGISGVYKGCDDFTTDETGVIGYVDVSIPCPDFSGSSKKQNKVLPARSFVYCKNELEGWVFLPSDTEAPCAEGNYAVRSFLDEDSIPLNRFDILTHSKANWVVDRPNIGSEASLTNVVVDSVLSFQSEFVNCGDEGLIRTDRVGAQRAHKLLPYEDLYYPKYEGKNSEAEGKHYYDAFGKIFRPVYIRKVIFQERLYSVVFFDGLRWNRILLNPLKFAQNVSKVDECILDGDPECWRVFVKYFHSETSWKANFTVARFDYISEPMIILAAKDTGVPTDQLLWYEARNLDGRVIVPGKSAEAAEGDDYSYNGGVNFGYECEVKLKKECGAEDVTLKIEFDTDLWPYENNLLFFYGQSENDIEKLEVAGVVIPTSSEEKDFTIPDNGLTDVQFVRYEEAHLLGVCVPKADTCIQVVVSDSYGDGVGFGAGVLKLDYNQREELVTFRGEFMCLLYQFGAGCKNATRPQPTFCDFYEIYGDENDPDFNGTYPDVVTGDIPAEVPLEDNIYDTDYMDEFFWGNESIGNPSYNEVFTLDPTEPFDDGYPSIDVPLFELSCDEGNNEIGIQFQIKTDNFPEETQAYAFFGEGLDDVSSQLVTNEIVFGSTSGEFEIAEYAVTFLSFPSNYTGYLYGSCIPLDSCIQVVIFDTYGDGFLAPGEYAVTYGEETVAGDANEEWTSCRTHQFGAGCSNPDPPADCSSYNFTDIIPQYTQVIAIEGENPNEPSLNTIVPSFELLCDEESNEIGLQFQITTDVYPQETQLYVFFGGSLDDVAGLPPSNIPSSASGEFEMAGGVLTSLTFEYAQTVHIYGSCVPVDNCIQVVILDEFGDGFEAPGEYSITYGDETVVGNDSGWTCRTYQFGAGCTYPDPSADCSAVDFTESLLQNTDPIAIDPTDPITFDPTDPFTFDPTDLPPTPQPNSDTTPTPLPTLDPTPDPTSGPTPVPSQSPVSPERTTNPTESPSVEPSFLDTSVFVNELLCDEGDEIGIQFQATTYTFPDESQLFAFLGQSIDDAAGLSATNKMIPSSNSGEFEMSGDALTFLTFPSFSSEITVHTYGACVPRDTSCVQVVLLEAFGFQAPADYVLAYGDETVNRDNDDEWTCRTYQFGAGCTNLNPPIDCSLDAASFALNIPPNIVDMFF